MTKLYYRLCKGLNDYGSFYPKDQNVYDIIDNYDVDWYKSVYYYTEEQKQEAEKEITVEKRGKKYTRPRGVGTIRDVEGSTYQTIEDVITDQLVWDLDSNDVELSRKETIKLVNRLSKHDVPKEAIEINFSGNKGFSVAVQIKEFLTPTKVKNICQYLADGLSTLDSRIYNPARIFRVPLTQHQGSQLYKTPIPISTLRDYDADAIKIAAQNKTDPEDIKGVFLAISMPSQLKEKGEQLEQLKVEPKPIETPSEITNLDWGNRLKFLTPAKFVLHNGLGYGEGQRHDVYMILASSYKNAGFSIGDSYRLLKSVDEKHCAIRHREKFPVEELWDNILGTVYSDSWQGGTYKADHPILQTIEEQLPTHLKRRDNTGLVENEFIFDKFKKFAIDIDKNTLKLGIPDFDKKIRLLAGTSVGILGCPGSGKTSLAMNLLEHNSLAGEDSIFYSLDMNESLIVLKQIQKTTGLSNNQIFDIVKNDPEEFQRIRNLSIQNYENVMYSFRFGITPADIRNDIVNYQEKTGRKIRLVVVDYLENVQSGYTDPTVGAGFVAQQLANIAADEEVLMVILLQTQKSVHPGESIESMRSIKGASVIEQSLSVALGIHREGHQIRYKDYDDFMTTNILKNRFGPLDRVLLGWEGAKSRIFQMDKDHRLKYQDLMDLKKEDKEEEERTKNSKWGA